MSGGVTTYPAACGACHQAPKEPVTIPNCGHTMCRACVPRPPAALRAAASKGNPATAECPACKEAGIRHSHRCFDPQTVIANHALQRMMETTQAPMTQPLYSGPTAPTEGTPVTGYPRGPAAPHGAGGGRQFAHRAARMQALQNFGIPFGMAEVVEEQDRCVGFRIFILDNSGSTDMHDGTSYAVDHTGNVRPRTCTRWEEIKDTAMQQAQLNAQLGTPCTFFLLNPSLTARRSNYQVMQEGKDYCMLDPQRGDLQPQIDVLAAMLAATRPGGTTPLAESIMAAGRTVDSSLRVLEENGQTAFLIIITDGVPTPTHSGTPDRKSRDAMLTRLRKLTLDLPLFVVVRLCTNEDDVLEFWQDVDEEVEFRLDVLDDLRSEAMEIHKAGNDWLAYTPAMHLIREGGTNLKLLDLLDERKLTPGEIAAFGQLFLGAESAPLPDWRATKNREEPGGVDFIEELALRLRATEDVYNVIADAPSPLIDINKVRKIFKMYLKQSQSITGVPRNARTDESKPACCTVA